MLTILREVDGSQETSAGLSYRIARPPTPLSRQNSARQHLTAFAETMEGPLFDLFGMTASPPPLDFEAIAVTILVLSSMRIEACDSLIICRCCETHGKFASAY